MQWAMLLSCAIETMRSALAAARDGRVNRGVRSESGPAISGHVSRAGRLRRLLRPWTLPVMSRSLGAVLAVVGALAVLTGCAAGPSLSTDATLKYDSRGDYAGLFGTAHVEQADGGLCVYVDSKSGIGKGRVNLIFPGGYSATSGGQVRDGWGSKVVSEGDRVAVSIAPSLVSTLPAGCTSAGVGTAKALHLERSEP